MLQDRFLDKNSPIPLYYQLKTILLDEIRKGNYKDRSLIPTENEIGEMFDISRTTVRQAISELVQEGHLRRVKSKGTFVTKPKVAYRLLSSVYDNDIILSGRERGLKVLGIGYVPIPKDIPELKEATKNGDQAIYVERLRMADDEPICVVKSYLRGDLFAEVLNRDMNVTRIGSIMNEKPETRVARLERTVEAVIAGKEYAEKLEIEPECALQKIVTKRYNHLGELMDVSYGFYRGDKNMVKLEILNPPEDEMQEEK